MNGEECMDDNQTKNANNKVDSLYNIWLRMRDSSPRMPEPKPDTLPLGQAPLVGNTNYRDDYTR